MLITDYIGTPIFVHASTNATGSDALAASDNIAGVSVGGIQSILFLVSHAAVIGEGGAGAQVQFQYSSTGNDSDAATSNATMSCTDAIITFTTAVNAAAGIYTVEVDCRAKEWADRGGKLYAAVRNDSTSNLIVQAVPLGGTGSFPLYAVTVLADDGL